MQISPKEDEVKALQKYSGPFEELSPPEQFLLIMSSVPRLNEKIHLLMLMHQFEVPYYNLCTDTCHCPARVLSSRVRMMLKDVIFIIAAYMQNLSSLSVPGMYMLFYSNIYNHAPLAGSLAGRSA